MVKLLRTGRNHHILHMPMELMNDFIKYCKTALPFACLYIKLTCPPP